MSVDNIHQNTEKSPGNRQMPPLYVIPGHRYDVTSGFKKSCNNYVRGQSSRSKTEVKSKVKDIFPH